MKNETLKLSFTPHNLVLKHIFTIATNSRIYTPIMLTELTYEGITGYGEASMPPYLGESHASVSTFLSKTDFSCFKNPLDIETILQYVNAIAPGNTAAKASIDIALHDLTGKLLNQPWYKLWGYDPYSAPETSFTIGIDNPESVKQKTQEASDYKILKVKLGQNNDKQMIQTIRSLTDKPLYADVNQGWTDKYYALDMINWLYDMGVVLIEQPLAKENMRDLSWLTSRSPIPVFADEGIQRLEDLEKISGVYSGINVKLMKCTGMFEAHKLIEAARNSGMKTMIGCMTETSCAVTAAAHLAPACDFADLDGSLLITNDFFDGMKIEGGTIMMTDRPGIGISKLVN